MTLKWAYSQAPYCTVSLPKPIRANTRYRKSSSYSIGRY